MGLEVLVRIVAEEELDVPEPTVIVEGNVGDEVLAVAVTAAEVEIFVPEVEREDEDEDEEGDKEKEDEVDEVDEDVTRESIPN